MATPPFPSPTSKWHDTTYPSLSPTRPELSAKGKIIVITGGGTGIGAETARAFGSAGASRIALFGRRQQPLLDTRDKLIASFPGIDVLLAVVDVTDKAAVDTAIERFAGPGKIDILVSNAGMVGAQEAVNDIDIDKFMTCVDQNLRGALNVAQAFLRNAADDAVVIETNSSAAHLNFSAKFAAYSTAKLAVCRMWDSFAVANPGARVFHVQPGIVDTDMNKESGGVKAVGFEDHVSLPATFYVWLASPEARFLKGKFLWSNWDVDELKARAEEIKKSSMLEIGLNGWPFGGAAWTSNWEA